MEASPHPALRSRDAGLIGVEQPYKDIAEQLTLRGVPTPRGGDTWNAMTAMRVLNRRDDCRA